MQAMRFFVGAAAVLVGACVSEPDLELASSSQPATGDTCPTNSCGDGNSPVIDGVYFWRLHVGGAANPEDVRITDVRKNGVQMQLRVLNGDYLVGVDPGTQVVLAQGSTLPGTRIKLAVKGLPYEIRIAWAAPSESFWVGALPQSIWAYQLYFRPLFGPVQRERPLCSEADGDPNMLEAIVFTGDLYNPDTKEITVGAVTNGWMNIACESSAIYKMHKIAHTSAAQGRLGIATTVPQRRAMLNAWTSKICPAGEAFTQPGEPIKLRESLGLLPATSPYLDPLDETQTESIEAVWSETGAVCLTTHRREDDELDVRDRIEEACGALPVCEDLPGDPFLYGHVLTGNPFPGP